MAGDTIRARQGALWAAIKKAGFTQEKFAEKVDCSRTTLQTINAGKVVKTETLREVADHLQIPMSHLMEELAASNHDDGPDQIATDYCDVLGEFVSIRLRLISTADDLRKTLQETDQILWSLQINDVSDELERNLLEFEGRVLEFNTNESIFPPRGAQSLAKLLEIKKYQRDIEKEIERLAEIGVYLYGGSYIHWSEEHSSVDHEDRSYPVIDYNSRRMAVIVIESNKTSSIRFEVNTGEKPPSYRRAKGPIIKVNGDFLPEKDDVSAFDCTDNYKEETYLKFMKKRTL